MKRIVSVFALGVLAVSCAQKADDSAESDSTNLRLPSITQDLGEVIKCRYFEDREFSLRLEKGPLGGIWLKGDLVFFFNSFRFDKLDALVTRIDFDKAKPTQVKFVFDPSKPGIISGLYSSAGKRFLVNSMELLDGNLRTSEEYGGSTEWFGTCTASSAVIQKASRILKK